MVTKRKPAGTTEGGQFVPSSQPDNASSGAMSLSAERETERARDLLKVQEACEHLTVGLATGEYSEAELLERLKRVRSVCDQMVCIVEDDGFFFPDNRVDDQASLDEEPVAVTMWKSDPTDVDEITATFGHYKGYDVHIERMGKKHIWMRIGSKSWDLKSRGRIRFHPQDVD